MQRNKLLLLLALLMTAATGAWAQSTPSVKKLTVPDTWTGDMTTFSAADLPSDFAAVGDDVVTTIPAPTATGNAVLIYGFSGGETKFVEYANGVQSATNSSDFPRDQIYGYVNIMGYEGVYYTAAAPAGYTVSMKDGVKDADKWTITPYPAEEGQTVTLQYNGRLKVKGVKATSDEAPAEAPTITLDNTTTAWTAGKYAVPAGGLTYSDAITVSGDVTLVLTDGETLTLNKGISLASGATLTVEGNGTMNVNGTSNSTASTVAGSTGTLILTSGTLTATGGNGGNIGHDADDSHGGNGGDAINGSVIVSGGTLTARGGNGGSVDYNGDNCSGGNGGDAISGTLTKNGGSTSVNDGSNGSIGSNCDNCSAGTGGKAAPAAKPAATVTTAPTGAAIVGVGKTTALVSGGVADGGTLWYAVTTTNTKPTSTAGFSDAVPTAETIKASGKVYVWYYVKGDDTHSDSEIAATAIEVPVADIVWDATNISDLQIWGTDESYTKEGVTLSCNAENISAEWADYGDPATAGIFFAVFDFGGYTFTAPTGKAFTKIEMKAQGPDGWMDAYFLEQLGTGWAFNNLTVTWTGSAASTDKLLPDTDDFTGAPVKCIGFYLSE